MESLTDKIEEVNDNNNTIVDSTNTDSLNTKPYGITRKLNDAQRYLEDAKEYLDFFTRVVDGVISDHKKLEDTKIDDFVGKKFGNAGRDFYTIFKKHYLKNSTGDTHG